MKIATRLALGFGLLLLLIVLFGGDTLHRVGLMQDSFSDVSRMEDNKSLVGELLKTSYQARMRAWIGTATHDADQFKRAQNSLSQVVDLGAKLLESLKDPTRRQLIEETDRVIAAYQTHLTKVQDLVLQGAAVGTKDLDMELAELNKAGAKIGDNGIALDESYTKSEKEIRASYENMIQSFRNFSLALCSLALFLGIGIGFSTFRSIAPPIKAMTHAMETLAEGDLATIIPSTERTDEIGEMAKAMQVFKDNALQVEKLRRDQETAAARAAAERKEIMNDMADRFEAKVMGIVKVVSSSSSELQATAQNLSADAQQASDRATTVAAAATETTANVQTVASASEELSSSIREISGQVAEAAKIAVTASEKATKTNAMVQTLSEAASKIGDVVSLINDIAAQTNLLALNATIEAARAGDAGKGFAVVANEVKSLATQTAHATEEIGGQVRSVQEETTHAVEAIDEIGKIIVNLQQISSAISAAVEEQGAATQEIARNVQQASMGTQDVSVNIVKVTEAAATTGAAAHQVLASAGDLAKNAEQLNGEMTNFLAQVRAG
jgi:methyl-accepting chemotaxis protein